jgi:hypothetical protein
MQGTNFSVDWILIRDSVTLLPSRWIEVPCLERESLETHVDLYQACFDEKEVGEHPKAVTLDGSKRNVTIEDSRDQKNQEELWEKSVKLAGLKEGDTVLVHWK